MSLIARNVTDFIAEDGELLLLKAHIDLDGKTHFRVQKWENMKSILEQIKYVVVLVREIEF